MARHHRRSVRLPGYDYRQPGAYFVTICIAGRACVLGDIAKGELTLSALGDIAAAAWTAIPEHYAHVTLDAYVVMPNHLHGVIVLMDPDDAGDGPRRGTIYRAPTSPPAFGTNQPGSLADIVGKYKAAVTRQANRIAESPGRLWQRGYHEHVIRNEDDLSRIRQYIIENPARWQEDALHPNSP